MKLVILLSFEQPKRVSNNESLLHIGKDGRMCYYYCTFSYMRAW